MESAEKEAHEAPLPLTEETIGNAFKEHVLLHGQRPVSIYKFCRDLNIPEEAFYQWFGSFDALEKFIWNNYAVRTIARVRNDETFANFSSRERILSFYFTLLEELRKDRSFVLQHINKHSQLELAPRFLKRFQKTFLQFIDEVLLDGKANGEIATRPLLENQYPRLFWIHVCFILRYWCTDESPGFESTDVAVEKSLRLAFDLVGKGALDTAIDFGKFLYQQRFVVQ